MPYSLAPTPTVETPGRIYGFFPATEDSLVDYEVPDDKVIAYGSNGSIIALVQPVPIPRGILPNIKKPNLPDMIAPKRPLKPSPETQKNLNRNKPGEDQAVESRYDIAFAMLKVRDSPTRVSDSFAIVNPKKNREIETRTNFNLANREGTQIVIGREIGFWGIHFKLEKYDPAKVPGWKHPLTRRNFGTVAFCRNGNVMFEQSLHYSSQYVLQYELKANLQEYPGYVEYISEYPNKIFGQLEEGVIATISFLPVYEIGALDWVKNLELQKTCAEKALKLKKEWFAKKGINIDDPPTHYCVKRAPYWKCDDPASEKESPRISGHYNAGNVCSL